ncbi:hypothetical protein N825_13055 [Skermanella stibiiresistens SB22]|uniref:Uncharacterized protein n=1 Tax=Skermanella stibiiresistens SB22 TaxID=1385369 RepID=W9GXF6_9PROT|nr:hypothetical protein N825_13055 [Skermanella stibiiresistens SB22]
MGGMTKNEQRGGVAPASSRAADHAINIRG